MAIPWYGWVGIAVVGIGGVAVLANVLSRPQELPQGPVQNPVQPTQTAPVDAGAEAARGTFNLLTEVTRTVGSQVAADRAAAEARREADAARAERAAERNAEEAARNRRN